MQESEQREAVRTAFAARFRPTYGSILEPQWDTLELATAMDQTIPFVVEVREYNGGFAGKVFKGQRTIAGAIDLSSGEVSFVES